MKLTEEVGCRVCKGEMIDVLDLGSIYPSGFVDPGIKLEEEDKVPLVLAKCIQCGLVQLRHTVELDSMYRQYWYTSSLNKSMVSSLKDIVTDIESRVNLAPGDTVVDIGCNDGTMLQLYSADVFKIGFDPALNLERPKCDYFYNDYFTSDGYYDIRGQVPAKVITAIAMFYDLPDPVKFVKNVASILNEKGIFVIQFTDLFSMFKATAFDNVCHEHLEYYRLKDVMDILSKAGMEVIDVSYNDVNGGSIRVTAAHKGSFDVSSNVNYALNQEALYFENHGFDEFKQAIDRAKLNIDLFFKLMQHSDLKVFLLGASTKGNTLLQVCNITNELVPYAAEVNPEKFGLVTIGSNIEIISEEDAMNMKPDYFFVPVWHFEESLLSKPKIKEYLNNGGRLIFPLPNLHTVEREI